jgi:hypothetical protein
MPSEDRIVRVRNRVYFITISQRSKIAWVAVGEYVGTYIEAVGPSTAGAARRWVAAAAAKVLGKRTTSSPARRIVANVAKLPELLRK